MGGVVENEDKVPFEEALNKSGFGLYSYLLLSVSGLVVIAVVCTAYGNTIIVPTSACELQTTTAQRGVLAAVPVVGLIVGGILWGYLADVFGRRLTLIISLISSAVVNSLASISVNWIMLMILQFIATLLSSGQYSMAMTMLSESVPMVKRNIVVLLVGSIFLLAQGIMAVLAIPIIPLTFSYELPTLGIYWNSWRTLLLVYSAPSILSALWLFFMYESPKFLFAKGRETEALKILKNIHRLNNLGSKSEYNVQSFEADTTTSSISKSAKEQILPLFKSPLLKNTIILTLLFIFQQIGSFQVWLPTITNKLVEILETGEGSNLTLCGILRSSISAPPDVINRIGRRNMVMFVAAFCGLCGIIVNLVPNAIGSAVMFFILLIGIVNIGLYTAMAVALFPTYLRALAVAFTMTGSRIGAFASVQILNVLLESNCEVGFYVYSAVFASSAVIALFLANDRSP
ncbi:synaptic vesicle 2-related protein-like isoform X2 [Nymphalis io]|uniref:synaptic vesicle 2-related protein-like isoform X2 n=1 Tax=Inachis io TaxID=171585 RepID=UPI00216863E8|nr:synaptic vesicle 2-related protein-like isoform X2 [Nymphalis io]